MKLYLRNVLVGVDQLFNAIFGGDPDETISSRVYRYRDMNIIARCVCRLLDWIQPNHCKSSLEPDDRHVNDVIK